MTDRVTWFKSSVPLNCTNILQSVHRKPKSEYKRMLGIEQMVRRERTNQWPDYSEFTDKYLLRSRVPPKLSGSVVFYSYACLNLSFEKNLSLEKIISIAVQVIFLGIMFFMISMP